MNLARVALSLVAGFVAGTINAVAGGGTLITYPSLVALGLNPITANATSTIALWPGYVAATLGFRRNLVGTRRLALALALPSLGGGALGAFLLLQTPTRVFEDIVPFLILGATVVLALQDRRVTLVERPRGRAWLAGMVAFLFAAAIYGGYFGAGLGFVLLAGFGAFGMRELLQASGLKNLLTVLINGMAAVLFIAADRVRWPYGLAMAAGAIAGGYVGATLATRVGARVARRGIVVIGLGVSIYLLVRAF